MNHYADDLAALTAHLGLKNAIHVGHSTGGGEVVHYVARHGETLSGRDLELVASGHDGRRQGAL
jgi:non-heme chloroperoxidase